MIEMFLTEAWLQLLAAAPESKVFVVFVARKFAHLYKEQADMMKFLMETDLKVIPQAWEQIARFCRACLLAFAETDGSLEDDVKAKDLFWFSEYKGSSLYERSMKAVLMKSAWWSKQIEDVAKSSSSLPVIRPQMQRLSALLGDDGSGVAVLLDGGQLQEIASIYEAVKGSLREAELEKTSNNIVGVIKAVCGKLMALGDLSLVSSLVVDAALKLLTLFAHVPGIPSLQEEFVSWSTKVQAILKFNGLLEALRTASGENIDFAAVRAILDNSPASLWQSNKKNPNLVGAVLGFLEKGCRSIVHKACRS